MEKPVLGFIGFGEAAFCICSGLAAVSAPVIYAYDVMANSEAAGELIHSRAKQTNVTLIETLEQLIDKSNVILCATSAKYALSIAKEAAVFLKPGKIYSDMNSASPMVKHEIAQAVDATGARFADSAVMEIVPPHKHRVPIAVSGSGAKAFASLLNPLQMNITYINDQAGSASSMKMFRSIFMKGMTALLTETLLASHQAGVCDEVMDSITKTLTEKTPEQLTNLLINRTAVAAQRRVSEMQDVKATLEALELPAFATVGTIKRLQWFCDLGFKEYFNAIPPADYHDVLRAATELKAKGEK
ncbi:MAG TPA: DUF1932 domain-containing protein [Clostridia bacterium]|nr:DUF1932 domain-containing protein [Clostridia bacterium]